MYIIALQFAGIKFHIVKKCKGLHPVIGYRLKTKINIPFSKQQFEIIKHNCVTGSGRVTGITNAVKSTA